MGEGGGRVILYNSMGHGQSNDSILWADGTSPVSCGLLTFIYHSWDLKKLHCSDECNFKGPTDFRSMTKVTCFFLFRMWTDLQRHYIHPANYSANQRGAFKNIKQYENGGISDRFPGPTPRGLHPVIVRSTSLKARAGIIVYDLYWSPVRLVDIRILQSECPAWNLRDFFEALYNYLGFINSLILGLFGTYYCTEIISCLNYSMQKLSLLGAIPFEKKG